MGANFAQIITMLMYTLGTITYPHPVGVFEDDFPSFLEGVNSDITFFVSTTFGDSFNESANISANFDLLIPQSPSSLSAGADADAHLILVGRRFCPGHQKQGLVVVIKSIIRMNVQKLKLYRREYNVHQSLLYSWEFQGHTIPVPRFHKEIADKALLKRDYYDY